LSSLSGAKRNEGSQGGVLLFPQKYEILEIVVIASYDHLISIAEENKEELNLTMTALVNR
jgi:hypothetical protein